MPYLYYFNFGGFEIASINLRKFSDGDKIFNVQGVLPKLVAAYVGYRVVSYATSFHSVKSKLMAVELKFYQMLYSAESSILQVAKSPFDFRPMQARIHILENALVEMKKSGGANDSNNPHRDIAKIEQSLIELKENIKSLVDAHRENLYHTSSAGAEHQANKTIAGMADVNAKIANIERDVAAMKVDPRSVINEATLVPREGISLFKIVCVTELTLCTVAVVMAFIDIVRHR